MSNEREIGKIVMQVVKRSGLIFNEIIFVFLSLVYLHISFSLDADISSLNLDLFLNLLKGIPFVVAFSIITALSILFVRKISIPLLSLFTLLIIYKTFSVFFVSYNKLLLTMNITYLICSYNMVLLLGEELKQAIYKPQFKNSSLEVENYKRVKIRINVGTREFIGNITNMDENGLVFKLDIKTPIKGKVLFTIDFQGNEFKGTGVIATRYQNGYGILVQKTKKSQGILFWEDFYNISYKRGLCN